MGLHDEDDRIWCRPRSGPFVMRVRGAGATRLQASADALAGYLERTAQA